MRASKLSTQPKTKSTCLLSKPPCWMRSMKWDQLSKLVIEYVNDSMTTSGLMCWSVSFAASVFVIPACSGLKNNLHSHFRYFFVQTSFFTAIPVYWLSISPPSYQLWFFEWWRSWLHLHSIHKPIHSFVHSFLRSFLRSFQRFKKRKKQTGSCSLSRPCRSRRAVICRYRIELTSQQQLSRHRPSRPPTRPSFLFLRSYPLFPSSSMPSIDYIFDDLAELIGGEVKKRGGITCLYGFESTTSELITSIFSRYCFCLSF